MLKYLTTFTCKTELDFRGNEESGLKVTSGLGKEINYFRLPITAYKGALGLNKDNSIIPGMTNLYRQVFEILAEEKTIQSIFTVGVELTVLVLLHF